MKKFVKVISYILLFCLFFVWMMPKANLYFQLEKILKEESFIISDEKLSDKGLWLQIDDAKIYWKQAEIAKAKKGSLLLFALYNRFAFTDVTLDQTLSEAVPADLECLVFSHSVLRPLTLFVHAKGTFGTAKAEISLDKRHILMRIKASTIMQEKYQHSLQKLILNDEGEHIYESSY